MESLFNIIHPNQPKVPILVSVPHAGMEIPENIKANFKSDLIQFPDDTDFYVDELYGFVGDMGITMIRANYSRWVIDLNRSPEDTNLYSDGRLITGLTPVTNFLGENIYETINLEPSHEEIISRKEAYYFPYYNAIEKILADYIQQFGIAILWDAHSIRRSVKSIHPKPFPDLILGTNEGASANKELIQLVRHSLSDSSYDLSYNYPFKGGYITRHFGLPDVMQHALQLEMTKDLYMDDEELEYSREKAEKIQRVLKSTFQLIIAHIATAYN